MSLEHGHTCELVLAQRAGMSEDFHLLQSVVPHVSVKRTFVGKPDPTVRTAVNLFTRVFPDVGDQIAEGCETLAAVRTGVRFGVTPVMPLH